MQNYKQHVSKLSSTMYEKDNTSWQRGFTSKEEKVRKKKKEFWVGLTFENECNSP